jgi:putative endonuclease
MFLIAKGYRILARRWRGPIGEVDIVARRRGVLAFVEVKAREAEEAAAYALGEPQMRRIAAAAEAWLACHPDDARCEIRFDAVLIVPRRLPRHILGAFEA